MFISRYNSRLSQFMTFGKKKKSLRFSCSVVWRETCFVSAYSPDASLLLGWLSHGNKLRRPTLSWNIPTDAQLNTWHYFSVQAERGNQSFRSGVICLTRYFHSDCTVRRSTITYLLLSSVSANLYSLCCLFSPTERRKQKSSAMTSYR